MSWQEVREQKSEMCVSYSRMMMDGRDWEWKKRLTHLLLKMHLLVRNNSVRDNRVAINGSSAGYRPSA